MRQLKHVSGLPHLTSHCHLAQSDDFFVSAWNVHIALVAVVDLSIASPASTYKSRLMYGKKNETQWTMIMHTWSSASILTPYPVSLTGYLSFTIETFFAFCSILFLCSCYIPNTMTLMKRHPPSPTGISWA